MRCSPLQTAILKGLCIEIAILEQVQSRLI